VNLAELRAQAFELGDGSGRCAVPEPAVKRWLMEYAGVAVPAGVTIGESDIDPATWGTLREPLVLKAFGPGLVHKSDLGAVALGLSADGVAAALERMADALAARDVKPAGYLVEEQRQQPQGGIELIFGVIRHPLAGALVLLGHGGVLAEVLGKPVLRPCPLRRSDAEEMVSALAAPGLLDGARGAQPVDRDAIVQLLLAIAAAADALGTELAELECNPVLAGPSGVVALDARLILQPPADAQTAPPRTDFGRLFAPRSIAVAGASATKVTFGNRFLAAYRAAGWADGLYAIHPLAAEIDGVPAVASVTEIPGGVDYLLAGIPAAACPELVHLAAGSARFVHVVSGGFGETGERGATLEQELLGAARASGVRLLGPNCMGIYSARGRQTFQAGAPAVAGGVSVLSQSGGLAGDILQAGHRAGLAFAQLASIGNAVDVSAAELLDWLVDDRDTQIVGLYMEGLAGGEALTQALRRADGRKPVVLLVGGTSVQGARAVASHTGAMTTDAGIWDAIARATGVTLASSLEDLIGCLAHLQRWAFAPAGERERAVLVVGPGGGASVLTTDACDRAGLRLVAVAEDVRAELRGLGYGAGTSLTNPLEIPLGPATSADAFARVLQPVLARQDCSDVLLHVNVAAYYGYGPPNLQSLADLIRRTGSLDVGNSRLALVLRNAEVARGYDADLVAAACRDARLPAFTTPDAAARAIAAVQRFEARGKMAAGSREDQT
jgi:acyl-CoA synthetase (NDP forming)